MRGDGKGAPGSQSTTPPPADTDDANDDAEGGEAWRGFVCPSCDVEGTSRYLLEYFETFRDSKVQFYGDCECVDDVCPAHDGGGFVRRLLRAVDNHGGTPGTCKNIRRFNASEVTMGKIRLILDGIARHKEGWEADSTKRTKDAGRAAKTTKQATGKYAALSSKESKPSARRRRSRERRNHLSSKATSGAYDKDNTNGAGAVGPSYFVGQPVRLFCHIDNSYHVGRIVDCRTVETEQPSLKPVSLDGTRIMLETDDDINRTQYLVRFRQGVDARRVAVHQWLYLEEHPLAVGVALVWANIGCRGNQSNDVEKARDSRRSSIYRPAQLVIRTAMEMAPVRQLNIPGQNDKYHVGRDAGIWALALLFSSRDHHAVIRLGGEKEGIVPAADFVNPPRSIEESLGRIHFHDGSLAVATSLACMECEEQKRVRKWHGLPSTCASLDIGSNDTILSNNKN